ncbi:hypothetical protein [Marinilabilia rubra]|uniref:Uncharacterized protein n=1 Tax=Marinilabilia rubra TaxID=2162893 RepID=A0A2U2B335_9BACT|nr:hypothetical protein [Marinilabilia rubra]PWD97473.1 hypothetical protein DDZ16_20595 [Marinilabilia rubra]
MKKVYQKIKELFKSPSLLVSIIALIFSALSIYFQFFNEKHTLEYATLKPSFNTETKKITIPLLIKNSGNQTEVLLNSELKLEVKNNDRNFFKRISPYENKESYVILAPGEFKTIYLVGDYKAYLFGTVRPNPDKVIEYSPITVFNDLLLKIQLTYLTKKGAVATEERNIGFITFNKNEKIARIDCLPTELKELNLGYSESEIISYSIVPQNYVGDPLSIDFSDTAAVLENYDILQLVNRILKEQGNEQLPLPNKSQ